MSVMQLSEQTIREKLAKQYSGELAIFSETDKGDVVCVINSLAFSMKREVYDKHSFEFNAFIDKTGLAREDPFEAFKSYPDLFKEQSREAIEAFERHRDRDVEALLEIYRKMSYEDAMKASSTAFIISRVDKAVEALQYDVRMSDVIRKSAFDYIDVQKGIMYINQLGVTDRFDFNEKVQESNGINYMMWTKNLKYLPKHGSDKIAQNLFENFNDYTTLEEFDEFVYKHAPRVRKMDEDICYLIPDKNGVIPRSVVNQNWTFRTLLKTVQEQEIKYLAVSGTSRKFTRWYSRLSALVPGLVVSYIDEDIYEGNEMGQRSMFLRCPFQNLYGSKFMPSYKNGARDQHKYTETFKEKFLKGSFPLSDEFDVKCSHYENYPLPMKMKEGRMLAFNDLEDHCFYGTTAHRWRGLFVQGKVYAGGDIYKNNDRMFTGQFFQERVAYTHWRNCRAKDSKAPIFSYELEQFYKTFRVEGGKFSRFVTEYNSGYFYPCNVDFKVTRDASVSNGLAQIMKEVVAGVIPYQIKYSDFPEELYHMREEIVQLALVLGVFTIQLSQGLESIYLVNLPYIMQQEVCEEERNVSELALSQTDSVVVSGNGGVIGDLYRPVTNVRFYEGVSAYNDDKVKAGIVRLQTGIKPHSLQKGRGKKRWEKRKARVKTVGQIADVMLSRIKLYASTEQRMRAWLCLEYGWRGSAVTKGWECLLERKGVVKSGDAYYYMDP